MNPLYVDIAVGLLTLVLAFQGWRVGFVRTAGSLVALVISVTLATLGVTWLQDFTGWNLTANPIVFVIVFLLLTLVLTKIMGMLVGILDLVRKIFQIIPGVGMLNSILGFLVGVLQSVMVIGATAFAAVNFLPAGEARNMLLNSQSISTAVEYLVRFNVL